MQLDSFNSSESEFWILTWSTQLPICMYALFRYLFFGQSDVQICMPACLTACLTVSECVSFLRCDNYHSYHNHKFAELVACLHASFHVPWFWTYDVNMTTDVQMCMNYVCLCFVCVGDSSMMDWMHLEILETLLAVLMNGWKVTSSAICKFKCVLCLQMLHAGMNVCECARGCIVYGPNNDSLRLCNCVFNWVIDSAERYISLFTLCL